MIIKKCSADSRKKKKKEKSVPGSFFLLMRLFFFVFYYLLLLLSSFFSFLAFSSRVRNQKAIRRNIFIRLRGGSSETMQP
jgi:uncharacterized membrane protein (DUF485 family)